MYYHFCKGCGGWIFCRRVGDPIHPPRNGYRWKARWVTWQKLEVPQPTCQRVEDFLKCLFLRQQNSLLETDERLCNPFTDLKASSDIKTPMSAGYLHKKSFFQNFPNTKNRFKLTRSESERKLPFPPVKLEKQDSTLTGKNKTNIGILSIIGLENHIHKYSWFDDTKSTVCW